MTGHGKRMAALTAAGLALAVLAGCAWRTPTGGAREEPSAGASAGTDTGAAEPDGADGDLRTYYEERIEEMKQTLLDERQERYISEYEYRERLAKLEQELRLLTAGAELDTAKQMSGQPETEPETASGRTPGGTVPRPEPEPVVRPTPLPSDSFRYSIQDGQATVTGYLGSGGTVAVPARIDGCPVVAVGDGAFRGADITAVILPDTVETVGWFAFADCAGLESVTLPAAVRSISYAAFENCTRLTVLCGRDSYAARWAASYGLPVQYI